jgi:hypothetical protein
MPDQDALAAAFLVCFLAFLWVAYLAGAFAGAAEASAAGAAAGAAGAGAAAGAWAKAPAANTAAIRGARSFFIYAKSWVEPCETPCGFSYS